MGTIVAIVLLLVSLLSHTNADIEIDTSFSPIIPPSYPLAVRNPYLSAWLPGNQVHQLPSAAPQFWTGRNLTWAVLARVDSQTFSLFGVPSPGDGVEPATVIGAQYTSTRTVFALEAATVQFQLEFLSPVDPKDYVRQSMPFSYLTVTASGNGQRIQIYSDIDNSWTGQFGDSAQSNWDYTTRGDAAIYTWTPASGNYEFSEVDDMAQWGQAIFASQSSDDSQLSSMAGDGRLIRSAFANAGSFAEMKINSIKTTRDFTAFAHNFGEVDSSVSATFAIGYVRDYAVNYLGNKRVSYYQKGFPQSSVAVASFLSDFPNAHKKALSFDAALQQKASAAAGDKYADILALSVRQLFGTIDITLPGDSQDMDDVMVFMKEISSNGNMNTMDVIFPAFPGFYVIAPEYIRLLVEPVVQYLDSGRWPHNFTIHDMGAHFPNATGHDDGEAEQMPIEESGNLLLLAYAYQEATGNTNGLNNVELFNSYADYLIENGLYPEKQLSTDDFAGEADNQTNLAIKATVALEAYGRINAEVKEYGINAASFANSLYTNGLGTDKGKTHFTVEQGNDDSWTTAFNLYPQVLFGFNTFPAAAIDMQTAFYPTKELTYGVPLDSRLDSGKTDWMMFAAATVTGGSDKNKGIQVRDMFIKNVHDFLTNGKNDVPFSDWYHVTDGTYSSFKARPVAGGHFAILALEGADQFSHIL